MKKLLFLLFITSVICTFLIGCKGDPVSSTPDDPDPPPPSTTVTDVDGNVYHTIKIGNQTWAVEDLRTTKYNDSSSIQYISDNVSWSATPSAAYCSYKNETNDENIKTFGLLYNWYAVNTGKLAPKGWHVPSMADWNTLVTYLSKNGYNWDSSKTDNKCAKSAASRSYWKTSATTGTVGNDPSTNNRSGFSALPVGTRYGDGVFGNRGLMAHWWSSTAVSSSYGKSVFITFERDCILEHTIEKHKGFAVRILKNR